MNAANEIAVDAFLNEKIRFFDISEIIDSVIKETDYIKNPTIDDIMNTNALARKQAIQIIQSINK